MKQRWLGIVRAVLPVWLVAQTAQAPGPYAGIALMRALKEHEPEWEAGYIRHLRQSRMHSDRGQEPIEQIVLVFAGFNPLQQIKKILAPSAIGNWGTALGQLG